MIGIQAKIWLMVVSQGMVKFKRGKCKVSRRSGNTDIFDFKILRIGAHFLKMELGTIKSDQNSSEKVFGLKREDGRFE